MHDNVGVVENCTNAMYMFKEVSYGLWLSAAF
jgi:hypothetical protein